MQHKIHVHHVMRPKSFVRDCMMLLSKPWLELFWPTQLRPGGATKISQPISRTLSRQRLAAYLTHVIFDLWALRPQTGNDESRDGTECTVWSSEIGSFNLVMWLAEA